MSSATARQAVAAESAAAVIAVQSAYLSAGQRCTAARRLIVQDRLADDLVAAILKLVDRIIIGAPHADPQPFMGPVIDNGAADHLQEQFLGLMMKGGKVIRRLDRPFEERPYLTPAMIDVTSLDNLPDEELFGPVLQLIRVADFDAAIDQLVRIGERPGNRAAGRPGHDLEVIGGE